MLPNGSWNTSSKNHRIESYKFHNKYIEKDILYAELYKCDGLTTPNYLTLYQDVEYHNDNGNFILENIQNALFICPGNQIGNCLRIICSSIIIAKYFNLKVFIDFDYPGIEPNMKRIIKSIFPQLCLTKCDTKYEKIDYADCVEYDYYYGTNFHIIDEGHLINLPTENNFAITENIYSVIPGNMSNNMFIKERVKLYKSIKFPAFLISEVNTFLRKHDNFKNFVGFHIRYTDNLTDASKQIFNTHKDIFFSKLKTITNQPVLVLSDNNQILEECKIINSDIRLADKCSNPLYQSLYEMLLLSKTSLIIGSNSSTFSYESAFFQGTNIEIYERDKWVLYPISDIYLSNILN